MHGLLHDVVLFSLYLLCFKIRLIRKATEIQRPEKRLPGH